MAQRVAILLALAVSVAAQSPTAQGRRLALVIANDAYEKLPKLTSPTAESGLMAETLTNAGFMVQPVNDMRLREFFETTEPAFLNTVQPGDNVVFYYSGYAIHGDDDNYLLPVDFEPQSGKDLELRSYHLGRMQDELEARGAALKVFILESGRAIDVSISGVGLPGMMEQPDVSTNSLFAFASSPNKTIPRNDLAVGLFTQAVVKYMAQPGLAIDQVFANARRDVAASTKESQIPSVKNNILDPDFFFINPAMTVNPPPPLTFTSTPDTAPAPQMLSVYAGGYGGKFAVVVRADGTWLSETSTQGITPAAPTANVTISVSPRGLAPGHYESEITISGSDMTASPQVIPVSYTITVPGILQRSNRRAREDYVLIPAGHFKMGCVQQKDKLCKQDERPQHEVTITKGFWMGRNEVEVDAYRKYKTALNGKKARMPAGPLWDPHWRQGNFPIVNVSWEDARNYCTWAGGRLPTEAEWEYAARAGADDQVYPLNDENSREKANFYGRKGNDDYDYVAPVRKFDASRFGLYDMAGNVWEWVNDFYAPDYYSHSPGVDPQGPTDGKQHIRRGGSYDSNTQHYLRISLREGYGRAEPNVGFRCVLDDTAESRKVLETQ